MNREFAQRIARWKRTRLAFTLGFAAAGVGVLFTPLPAASVPVFICSLIALIFYLESVGQYKEISARRWRSLIPRTQRSESTA